MNKLWYEEVEDISNRQLPPDSVVIKKEKTANEYIETDVAKFVKHRRSKDDRWIKDVSTDGTLTDKVAALGVLVESNPLCTLSELNKLIQMTLKKGRREFLLSVDTLKDLFITYLLPNRKLRYFNTHPLHDNNVTPRHLKYWKYEDSLKKLYMDYLKSIERVCNDTLPQIRRHGLTTVFYLLKEKPEQEEFLLSLLINKLGDTDNKTSSCVSHLLLLLLSSHPNMITTILNSLKQLLGRSSLSSNAVYYTLITLSQIYIKNNTVAEELLSIYLSLFQYDAKDTPNKNINKIKKKKKKEKKENSNECMTRLLPVILSGINRALPYTNKSSLEILQNHVDKLFKIVHLSNFQISIQSLSLLYDISQRDKSLQDRFIRSFYSLLDSYEILHRSKLTMFYNLLYKILKKQKNISIVLSYFHKLLYLCLQLSPPFICCTLYLISQVSKFNKHIYQYINTDNNVFYKNSDHQNDDDNNSLSNKTFDPNNRNPCFSNAELSPLWELSILSNHYHPSVKHFADSIINNKVITSVNDPLNDFTLTNFLNKFMYKNIKSKDISVVQRHAKKNFNVHVNVNTPAFYNLPENKVQPDDLFFYKFFKIRPPQEKSKESNDSEEEFANKIIDEKMSHGPADIDDISIDYSDEESDNKDDNNEMSGVNDMDDVEFDGDGDDLLGGDGDELNDDIDMDDMDGLDDIDDGDAELMGDDMNDTIDVGHQDNRKKKQQLYYDADDFAEILENSGKSGKSKGQSKWENKQILKTLKRKKDDNIRPRKKQKH